MRLDYCIHVDRYFYFLDLLSSQTQRLIVLRKANLAGCQAISLTQNHNSNVTRSYIHKTAIRHYKPGNMTEFRLILTYGSWL